MKNYSSVPPDLQKLKQWVCYKLIWNIDKNKFDKLPYNPVTGSAAKVNDMTTWATFDTAVQAAQRIYDGIGIMLYGGLCGIDIDHCINEQGTLTAEAADIITTMNSYTEKSISGTGIHILFYGSIPDKDSRNGSYEMYADGKRYFTVSGNVIGSSAVNERTKEAAAVHKKYIQRNEPTAKAQPPQRAKTGIISDNNLLYRMINSAAGAAIRALYDGDTSAYNGDQSAADIALCNHLAYWTNGNREQMDSMFRSSGLMRDKWNEQRGISTYGQMTINKALEDFKPYQPQPKPYKIFINRKKF